MKHSAHEAFVTMNVTYAIEIRGEFMVVENVPAQVSLQTGEQFFAPATVERIHRIVNGDRSAARTMSATIFEFDA